MGANSTPDASNLVLFSLEEDEALILINLLGLGSIATRNAYDEDGARQAFHAGHAIADSLVSQLGHQRPDLHTEAREVHSQWFDPE